MLSNLVGGLEHAETTSVLPTALSGRDSALVAAAKSGDSQAFEILVGLHRHRIFAVVSRFARIREDAEDIVQLSFQKAFVHLPKFEGKSTFSTWLTRIAINEALMWLRRKRASPEVSIEESDTANESAQPMDFPDSHPSPEDSCLHGERRRVLAAAMNELSPGMRTAVELRDLSELSTEETARVMELSVEAVKGRLFHARKKLRESLKDYVGSAWRSRRNSSRVMGYAKRVPEDRLTCNACG